MQNMNENLSVRDNTNESKNVASRFEARQWREEIHTTREERDATTGEYTDVPVVIEAQWAVYVTDSGVRMSSESKDGARKLAEKWNTKGAPEKIIDKADSARYLKSVLNPGDTVVTILRNCSRSGMSRRISLAIGKGSEVEDITWHAAQVMGESVKGRAGYVQDVGITVGGCGMDMGFHLVYNLGRILWPDGFVCPGESCRSNDHCNVHTVEMRRENFKGNKHTGDGGYALTQRWL
jgi:hypothetical protein